MGSGRDRTACQFSQADVAAGPASCAAARRSPWHGGTTWLSCRSMPTRRRRSARSSNGSGRKGGAAGGLSSTFGPYRARVPVGSGGSARVVPPGPMTRRPRKLTRDPADTGRNAQDQQEIDDSRERVDGHRHERLADDQPGLVHQVRHRDDRHDAGRLEARHELVSRPRYGRRLAATRPGASPGPPFKPSDRAASDCPGWIPWMPPRYSSAK